MHTSVRFLRTSGFRSFLYSNSFISEASEEGKGETWDWERAQACNQWITRSRGKVLRPPTAIPGNADASDELKRLHFSKVRLELNFDVFQEDVLIQRLHPQLCVPIGRPSESELVLGSLLFIRITRRCECLLFNFQHPPMSYARRYK